MEPKHKELLHQCHQNLLESITDPDPLIELLGKSGTLSDLEALELDQNCSSSAEKVEQLLKMLMNKQTDHFLELCVALEKTYPHLYSAIFTNGGGPAEHSGKTFSELVHRCGRTCVHRSLCGVQSTSYKTDVLGNLFLDESYLCTIDDMQ